jgi:hypothetical protein
MASENANETQALSPSARLMVNLLHRPFQGQRGRDVGRRFLFQKRGEIY